MKKTQPFCEHDLIASLGRRQERLVRSLFGLLSSDGEGVRDNLQREFQHRLRNLLQAIANTLSAQAQAESSPSARQSLRQALLRLQGAAAVQQFFLHSREKMVDLREFIPFFLSAVLEPAHRKEVQLSLEHVVLFPFRAEAFALILNELVSNGFRHGRGPVQVRVVTRGRECFLEVEDSGSALPEDFSLEKHSGLGLRVVCGLLGSGLKGSFLLEEREGRTAARAQFSLLTGEMPSDTAQFENPCCGGQPH